jgi:hypothetical protein
MEDEGSGQPASSGLLECACVGIIDLLHSDPGVQTSFSPAALPMYHIYSIISRRRSSASVRSRHGARPAWRSAGAGAGGVLPTRARGGVAFTCELLAAAAGGSSLRRR